MRRWRVGNQLLAEVMITPGSRLVGQTLRQIGFRYRYHCVVLGMQRRSQLLRARFVDVRFEPGDVLLIQGRQRDIEALRGDSDILLIEWSATEVPAVHNATSTLAIFLAVVAVAAPGILHLSLPSMPGSRWML